MTKPKVVFDPFSEEYFNNPFDIYRRMREDAPLYYDEKEDFYALTRHEDVAAAFKDFETYSSSRGCDLSMVRKGISAEHEVDHLHGSAGPPAHAQPAQQGLHAARHSIAARDGSRGDRQVPGRGRSRPLRRGAGLLRAVPGRGHHHGWPGCRRNTASRCGTGSTPACHREPGQIEISEAGMQANIDTAMYYFGLVQERRAEPAGRHDQQADRRRDPRRRRSDPPARRHRNHAASPRFWAAPAPRPSPS